MSLLQRIMKQDAVYWEPSGTKNQFAKPIFLEPVDIKCAWEDVKEEFLDEDGKEAVSDAVIFVDRDVALGGLLLQGKLEDLEGPDPSQGQRIRKFEKIF